MGRFQQHCLSLRWLSLTLELPSVATQVELVITFIAHAVLLYFQDAWRMFDLAVVTISLVSASGIEMPAVKSIRAVRVLRAVG